MRIQLLDVGGIPRRKRKDRDDAHTEIYWCAIYTFRPFWPRIFAREHTPFFIGQGFLSVRASLTAPCPLYLVYWHVFNVY